MHRVTNLILLFNLSVDLDANVPLHYALNEGVIPALKKGGAREL
jgi:hypothetical protein